MTSHNLTLTVTIAPPTRRPRTHYRINPYILVRV